MNKGKIVRIISNLYSVLTDTGIIEARARGKFRKDEISPMVGDEAKIDIEKKYILEIFIPFPNAQDAKSNVSVVIPDAVAYLPLEDLVDFEKEKERLNKEKDKLTKELARSRGMLSNEKFLNNAKPEKVQEEKDKLAKYEQMMEQVQERLAQMK